MIGGISGVHRRYEALDSLRGVCACMVVLYHLRPDAWLTSLALARNGWLFVDFFFVLSGFVIAASYGDRLAQGYPIARFMALRLGRVYPLHLFAIVLILGVNLIATGAALFGEFDLPTLLANLLLLHSFGVTDRLSWNGPSWSIAAEVWAYLSFALLIAWRKRIEWRVFGVLAASSLGALVIWSEADLATTYRLGFIRCLFGFSLGVLVWLAHKRRQLSGSTLVEAAVVALVGLYVALVAEGPLTYLAPPAFAIAVFVFADEGGAISKLLRSRPFRLVGLLSYSIYMLHHFALARYFDLLGAIGRWSGVALVAGDGQSLNASQSGLLIELLTLGALAFTIFLAWFGWRFVETPARAWSRRKFANPATAPLPNPAK